MKRLTCNHELDSYIEVGKEGLNTKISSQNCKKLSLTNYLWDNTDVILTRQQTIQLIIEMVDAHGITPDEIFRGK